LQSSKKSYDGCEHIKFLQPRAYWNAGTAEHP
jgi:hypothetical protein